MKREPLVTVVIPVYNRPIVVNTIKSLIHQTYKNIEILIIDNNSTDNTVREIRSIEDNRIRILVNDSNKGQTYSMNRGIDEARGEYIARIDSDDIACEDRIAKQVEYMENNPECVICGSWVRTIDDDGALGRIIKSCEMDASIRYASVISCPFFHPAVLVRKKTLVDNALYYSKRYKIAEDYDLWVSMLKHGYGYNIPEVLTYYRQGEGNDSKKHEAIMRNESWEIQFRERSRIEDDVWRRRMVRISDIEKKEKLSMKDAFVVSRTYIAYARDYSLHSNMDYKVIKEQVAMKIYSDLVSGQDNMLTRVIKRFARIYKKIV